jgi:hypothetical protein
MTTGYILCFGFTVRGNGRKKNCSLWRGSDFGSLEAVIERNRDVTPVGDKLKPSRAHEEGETANHSMVAKPQAANTV